MISLEQFSTFTDSLGYLGNRAKLSIVVSPWNKINNKNTFFYSEYQYSTSSTQNRKMMRNFHAYLLLKYMPIDNIDSEQTFILTSSTLEAMRFLVLPKLEDIVINFNKVFEMRKNKWYINNQDKKYTIAFNIDSKSALAFEPSIYRDYKDEINPCIDMYFNGSSMKSSLSFTDVMKLIRLIRLFDIESYAATLISTLPKIDIGTNLVMSRSIGYDNNDNSPFTKKGNTSIK